MPEYSPQGTRHSAARHNIRGETKEDMILTYNNFLIGGKIRDIKVSK